MLYYISSCFIFIYLIIMIAVYCILLVVCTFIYLGLLEITNKVEYENRYKENKKNILENNKMVCNSNNFNNNLLFLCMLK